MKRSVTLTSPPPQKRKLVIPEPEDPIEDTQILEGSETRDGIVREIPLEEIHIDPRPNYDLVCEDFENGELEAMHEKLTVIAKEVSRIKDNKVQGVYASINKIWMSLGAIRQDLKGFKKENEYKIDKAFGQSNRLYAWMKHCDRVAPNLALPEMKYKP